MSHRHENCRLCSRPHSHNSVIFSYFVDSYFFRLGRVCGINYETLRAALGPALAARAEPCHWSEGRGVPLRERRAIMQVMLGVSLRARWDATLVHVIIKIRYFFVRWSRLGSRLDPSPLGDRTKYVIKVQHDVKLELLLKLWRHMCIILSEGLSSLMALFSECMGRVRTADDSDLLQHRYLVE